MSGLRQNMLLAFLLLMAGVAQGRLAHSLSMHGAQPDFILVTLACGATLVGGAGGVGLGLWAGLLTAALVPQTLGTFLVSRLAGGAFAGWLAGLVIQRSLIVPPLTALATTAVTELVYVLMAPAHHLRAWAIAVGGEALCNMLWAVPIFLLLRRLGIGHKPDDPFGHYS